MAKKKNFLARKVQEGLDRSLHSARRKGEERLTIMIIPHGREKIISLHLNWLMISFLAGTLFFAITLAGYGIYLQALRAREYRQMRALYGQNFQAALQVRESGTELEEARSNLMANLDQIGEILGFPELEDLRPEDADRLAAEQELAAEATAHPQMGPGKRFLPTVYRLRTLRNTLKSQNFRLAAVGDSLEQGIGVFSYLPLGRPVDPNLPLRDTSGYGGRIDPVAGVGIDFHTGFDISGERGTPIRATGSGQVVRIYRSGGGYGNAVVAYHGFGYYSLFAHLSSIAVETGQPIRRGDPIGMMGATGRATGTHLHYEIWMGDEIRIDPLPYICSLDNVTPTCREYNAGNPL